MILRARRLGGDNPEICVLRGMTPIRAWAGQTCTLYLTEPGVPGSKSVADQFRKAMDEQGTVRVEGSGDTRSVVAEVRIVGVDPADTWASAVFVADAVVTDSADA
jgi:hypothetical protein